MYIIADFGCVGTGLFQYHYQNGSFTIHHDGFREFLGTVGYSAHVSNMNGNAVMVAHHYSFDLRDGMESCLNIENEVHPA